MFFVAWLKTSKVLKVVSRLQGQGPKYSQAQTTGKFTLLCFGVCVVFQYVCWFVECSVIS